MDCRRKQFWGIDFHRKESYKSTITKMTFVSLFFTVFLLLNLIDFAMTLYGLSLGVVTEFNDFYYKSYFYIMKLAFVPIIITLMLWFILHRNSKLAYLGSILINSAYTMVVINNFVAIMFSEFVKF